MALIRAAAKNHQWVAVVVDPGDYNALCQKLDETNGYLDLGTRRKLAAGAFRLTTEYDAAIAEYFYPGGGYDQWVCWLESTKGGEK